MITPCVFSHRRPQRLNGYVTLRVRGKQKLQHRHVWEVANGPIPKGMEIDHLCNNKGCCNLYHLELVTRSENCKRREENRITTLHLGMDHSVEWVYESRGKRHCRICKNRYQRNYYHANK